MFEGQDKPPPVNVIGIIAGVECINWLTLVNPIMNLMPITNQTWALAPSGIRMVNTPAQTVEINVTIIAPNLSDR